jgi:hypothetical protein
MATSSSLSRTVSVRIQRETGTGRALDVVKVKGEVVDMLN